METKFFEDYGWLEGIEPEEFYAGPWGIIGTASDDEDEYDIVINYDKTEYKYTTI